MVNRLCIEEGARRRATDSKPAPATCHPLHGSRLCGMSPGGTRGLTIVLTARYWRLIRDGARSSIRIIRLDANGFVKHGGLRFRGRSQRHVDDAHGGNAPALAQGDLITHAD